MVRWGEAGQGVVWSGRTRKGVVRRGGVGQGLSNRKDNEVTTVRNPRGTTTMTAVQPVSNDGQNDVGLIVPYTVEIEIRGSAAILFHRWSNEAVAEKAAAAKGSRTKKSDNLESYVYRLPNGHIALPGEYVRQSVINAARFRQDPRSPRKSAMDLFKAGVVNLTELADLGVTEPDYIDRRRVLVQRNAITRERPALLEGWTAEVELMVVLPEYISETFLIETITQAGRLIGVGDFRPTYGRFAVTKFKVAR